MEGAGDALRRTPQADYSTAQHSVATPIQKVNKTNYINNNLE